MTSALLSARDRLEWTLVSRSLSELIHEIVAAFDEVRRELESEASQAEGKGYIPSVVDKIALYIQYTVSDKG